MNEHTNDAKDIKVLKRGVRTCKQSQSDFPRHLDDLDDTSFR